MRRTIRLLGLSAVLVTAVGCGDDGPPMAEAGGIVTYNGAPLEGATVVFQPASGPLAVGTTDAEGNFELITGGEPQAAVGPGKVAITAVEQLIVVEGREPTAHELANMSRTLIPEKYGHVTTSGLTAEVKADEENELKFDLQGPPIERSGQEPRKAEAEPTQA